LHPIFAIDVPMHHQAPEAPGFGILKQLQPKRNPRKRQLPALFTQPGPNLALLAALIADGSLKPRLSEHSWHELSRVGPLLRERQIPGKAVFHIEQR
jgi:hypothetical protein